MRKPSDQLSIPPLELTTDHLALIVSALLKNPESMGQSWIPARLARFQYELAQLVAEECGGTVELTEAGTVVVSPDEDAPQVWTETPQGLPGQVAFDALALSAKQALGLLSMDSDGDYSICCEGVDYLNRLAALSGACVLEFGGTIDNEVDDFPITAYEESGSESLYKDWVNEQLEAQYFSIRTEFFGETEPSAPSGEELTGSSNYHALA
ncbi:Uncharacterised protein [Pseudomonas luteola]|uniref:Uncharacterized protein n=1 Tax=Pseudomonas luteola TaxID=47886 RepID=A0A2X2C9Q5_PSELU|nr:MULTISPECIES: hypothetical protein [Pseudomonas]SPZ04857.1 Uncharacterised protein [Pseudomonas luteola]